MWMVKSGDGKGWVDDRNVNLQRVDSRQPAAALLLTGITQHKTSSMGLYLLQTDGNQPVYHNNRPVYKHEAEEKYIYFWKETQAWLVGPDIHADRGRLYVKDNHVLPEDITGTWKVKTGERWVKDGNVTLQPAPAKQPAAALLLTGITQHQTDSMGLYLLQTDEHNQPLFSGSRPVYKHEAMEVYIYFWKTAQEWWVGPDIHAARGALLVKDSHVLPEDITGTWIVALPGESWVEDGNVTLQPARDERNVGSTGSRRNTGRTVTNMMSALSTSTSFYDKAAKPPFLGGAAVIINNINFSHESRRDGAEQDTGKMKNVLEMFDLSVDTYQDQTVEDMRSLMRQQGQADHSQHGCFVCCIMTHGDHGKTLRPRHNSGAVPCGGPSLRMRELFPQVGGEVTPCSRYERNHRCGRFSPQPTL
ncbi:CASP10 [Branchiostoma lanceolatum]|uniref:CASP10 protein n=1 Tax=Branchiostoma lanceolatum TaxID=7740 RepID=A0A8K0EFF5_BRALA|nr:CASP10 [Branchiostoma lanceolatum]